MNSSLEKNLELLKQKDAYPDEFMASFKRFNEKKLPDKKCFYSSINDGATNDDEKKIRQSHKRWRLFDVQKSLEWI